MTQNVRKINNIIIHCSATYPNMDIGAEDIRRWHTEGNGWSDIGYHYVICRDGTVETGRSEERVGAHVAGHNADSIGVCMVGGLSRNNRSTNNFTKHQWRSLDELVTRLVENYPEAAVKGHNDFTAAKTCPEIDIQSWWADN